jgi:hypothetical protein
MIEITLASALELTSNFEEQYSCSDTLTAIPWIA